MADPGDRSRVKVIDRRRFTADGDLRDGAAADASPVPPPEPAAAAAPAKEAQPEPAPMAPEAPAAEAPAQAAAPDVPRGEAVPLPAGPGIADIVDLLAQQSMAFLSGKVPGRGHDPATARYFIDLLGVLKEKTAGRLTLEETSFLDDVLYQLRSLYVAATR